MKIEDVYKSIVEAEKTIFRIEGQIKNIDKSLDSLDNAGKENARQLNDLHRDYVKEMVSAKKDVDELRRWIDKSSLAELKTKVELLSEKLTKVEAAQEKIGARAWSVVPNIAGAIVNTLLAAVVALVVAKLAK